MGLAAFRLVALSSVFCAEFGIIGCGSGTGTLSGEIKLLNKPIKSGAVVIRAVSGGPILTGSITDGHYSVSNVPRGPVKISITVSDLPEKAGTASVSARDAMNDPRKRQKAGGAGEPPAPPSLKVPNDLDDIDKTPLTYDTSNGFNKDFELP